MGAELYYLVRRGTNERIVTHDGKPLLVEEDYVDDTCYRYAKFLHCSENDLEAMTPVDYWRKYQEPLQHVAKKATELEATLT